MSLILQIETSTSSCSVALSENGKLLAVKELNAHNVHASHLNVFIQEIMKQSDNSFGELDAVAVSMGPGSYTGLRIGVSSAKGLCYALDIPLIAINTLKCMAAGISIKYHVQELLFCPMIDARRMEVYTAVFDKNLEEVSPVEAKIIDASSFEDILERSKVVFFGDGAAKCAEFLSHNPNAMFDREFFNSAADLSQLAFEKFSKSQFEDVAYFEPYYLKDFLVTQSKKNKVEGTSL